MAVTTELENIYKEQESFDNLFENMIAEMDNEELATYVEEQQDSESFEIESVMQADFFIRKYKELAAEKKEFERIAKEKLEFEKNKVEAWLEKHNKQINTSLEYIEKLLKSYAIENIDTTSKKKSISLPEGIIGFRKQQDEYAYENDVIADYLRTINDSRFFIPVEPKLDIKTLKKTGKAVDGKFYLNDRLVPGITVTPREDKFEVK